MDAWYLPISLEVHGRLYAIQTDFRVILNLLADLNDPDLYEPDADMQEKAYVGMYLMLDALYEDFKNMPAEDMQEAAQKAVDFIDMGIKDDGKRKPHTMDWQQDAPVIIPAINRIQGCEIRALPYLHWWTFLGAYMEIGECLFSQIVNIRLKKAKHKKLEKWEKDFYNANKSLIDFKKKISEEQQKEINALEKWL